MKHFRESPPEPVIHTVLTTWQCFRQIFFSKLQCLNKMVLNYLDEGLFLFLKEKYRQHKRLKIWNCHVFSGTKNPWRNQANGLR